MKTFFGVFILTVLLETQPIYSFQEIGDVLISYDENQNTLENTFQKAYGELVLKISQLSSEQITSMIPHLETVANTAKENPLGILFQYFQELCEKYTTLNSLNTITNNIQSFLTESGYQPRRPKTNVESNPHKVFSATSIDDNSQEIKKIFDDIDTDLMRENATKYHDAAIKEAEDRHAEALKKAEDDSKKAEQENELAKQKIKEEYAKALDAAEDMCENAIKKAEDDIKSAEREYNEARSKAEEAVQQSNADYEAVTEAINEEHEAAKEEAEKVLRNTQIKYEAIIAKGQKQYEQAKKRADARRQKLIDQYQASYNRQVSNNVMNAIQNSINKAECAYEQALRQVESAFNKQQADANKMWENAFNNYNKALIMAGNEANMGYVEAEKLRTNAAEEYDKIINKITSELYKKYELVDARKRRACENDKYNAQNEAEKARIEAINRLDAQFAKTLDLAHKELEKVEYQYHDEIDQIEQKYHDTLSEAGALEEKLENIMKQVPQNKTSKKVANPKKDSSMQKRSNGKVILLE